MAEKVTFESGEGPQLGGTEVHFHVADSGASGVFF